MTELIAVADKNGSAPNRRYHRSAAAPPVDIFENGEEVLVVADVPGVPSGSIDVHVENGTLTLETKRPAEPQEDAAPALAREYDEVDFVRTFRIPAGIDTENISAEAKNGTVVVRLPKTAAAKPHKITIRSG
jgi:HSP20 family protein